MFIKRTQWGIKCIYYGSEGEKIDNRVGVLVDTFFPALRRTEDINLLVSLYTWVVISANFSFSSSPKDSSLMLLRECLSATDFILPEYSWNRMKEDSL